MPIGNALAVIRNYKIFIPFINSLLALNGNVSLSLAYQITTLKNNATSYDATNLPNGLTINKTTGLISGIPTTEGQYTVTITAINSSGFDSKNLVITVRTAPPVITSSLTMILTRKVSDQYQIIATNNPTSYSASNLPTGATFNTSTGIIQATINTAGQTNCIITATNAGGTDTKTLLIDVRQELPVIRPLYSTLYKGVGFTGGSLQFFSGNIPPITYTYSGAFPPGITISSSGMISGTPTTKGSYTFTVTATNTGGTVSSDITITVI
jgi:PKD repeat protein